MSILSLTFHQMNSQVKKLLQRFCSRLRYYTHTLYTVYICGIVFRTLLFSSLSWLFEMIGFLLFLNCFMHIFFLIFWMSKFCKNRLVWIKPCCLFLYKAYKTFLLDVFWLWIIIIFFLCQTSMLECSVCMSAWW